MKTIFGSLGHTRPAFSAGVAFPRGLLRGHLRDSLRGLMGPLLHGAVLGAILLASVTANAQWGKGLPSFERNSFPGETNRQEAPGAREVAKLPVGFAACSQFFPTGRVFAYRMEARELCFSEFAVLYNTQTKSPAVVIERLNAQSLRSARVQQRTDQFFEDARLPARDRAWLKDYAGSGYDRGHMAPAGNMSTPEGMAQSFSLTNIVPQDAQNNRGIWADLEKSTRKYVMRAAGDVYVFTGPSYLRPNGVIGRGLPVPSDLWKVVYDAAAKRAWVLWVANDSYAQRNVRIEYAEFIRRGGPDVLQGLGF